MTISMKEFIDTLSSKSPIPGGGGASALIGAISAALCSMVANLTSGKKKYAVYQDDIDEIVKKTQTSIDNLLILIKKDGAAFEPLAIAYGIPKEDPNRNDILENALHTASQVPLEILKETATLVTIIEELLVKGSKLALSDVGVAASACKCAMESAAMNVYINTKLMQDRVFANTMNEETEIILNTGTTRCQKIYDLVCNELRCK